jgi:hypothetical protein
MAPVQASVSDTSRSCSAVIVAQRVRHFGNEGDLGADRVGIGHRLHCARQLLAERRRGVAGQQLADLIEFQ